MMLFVKNESVSVHCWMHHKWFCEKRNVLRFIFSLRIMWWLFSLLLLIHCQKKTNWRIKQERNSSIQIIQFSVRIVFEFFLLRKKLIWTFLPFFHVYTFLMEKRTQAYKPIAQNAKETSHLICRKYLCIPTNALLEKEWVRVRVS